MEIETEELRIRIHPECPNEDPIAKPAKPGDVGFDLKVWVEQDEFVIEPHKMANIRTGVFVQLPLGHWADIRPRSSTFARRHLFVMSGTIDEGYTGEISTFVWNPNDKPYTVKNGERLAQLVILPRVTPDITIVGELSETARSTTGFGSTGR